MYIQCGRKDPENTLEKFVKNAKVPIEHHFYNHQWRDASWCPFKYWDDQELEKMKKKQEQIQNIKCPIYVDPEVEKADDDDDVMEVNEELKILNAQINSDNDDEYEKEASEHSEEDVEYDTDDAIKFVKRGNYFEDAPESHVFEGFSANDAKKKEVEVGKKGKGHYWNIAKHQKLHDDIIAELQPYITTKMLTQLYHHHDTNLNETLNRSAMNYAPKDRTYSLSMSLETRIKIVAAIQLVGHVVFWRQVLRRLGIGMPIPLLVILKRKDKMRVYKREYGQKPEVKKKKSQQQRDQIKKGIEENKLAATQGKDYNSGIAIQVQKKAKTTVQNFLQQEQK